MLGSKEYIGIAVDSRLLDLVKIKTGSKKIELVECRQLEFVDPLEEAAMSRKLAGVGEADSSGDDIFGFDEEVGQTGSPEPEEDFDFDDLGDLDDLVALEEEPGTGEEVDLVDEADQSDSNEMLLYNYLVLNGEKTKHNIGLNIRSGQTVFQFARDTDYSGVKKKEVRDLIESKLQSAHGEIPSKDRYSYEVGDDGVLSIASIDREPASLILMNRTSGISARSRFTVRDIIPDEIALAGLYRMNYAPEKDDRITGLIQFREKRSRIIFLKGRKILQITPVITEGTSDKGFLNTVFSKILFQLDSGEVPGLNRIILCDNTIGEDAIIFFKKNFPELAVSGFELNPDLFIAEETGLYPYEKHTTALAVAVGASGRGASHYPALSIVPGYILDRQKVFKLQWHGYLLLAAIGLTPILLNHFYQENAATIDTLQFENTRHDTMIADMESTVQQTEIMEATLGAYREQLILLEELSEGNIRWTVSIDRFNQAVADIGGLWITTFRQSAEGLHVEGRSLQEASIPALARQFANVTLLNVTRNEVRERPLFHFTMRINRVVADESQYTPEETREISDFLESFN